MRAILILLAMTLCNACAVDIYWTTDWRSDQKEKIQRENLADIGINSFFKNSPCLNASVEKLNSGADQSISIALERSFAKSKRPDLVIFITIKELGPTLEIGFPVLVRGHTAVKLSARVYSSKTKAVVADPELLWKHGGAFVVNGTGTLSEDMEAALTEALQHEI